MKAAGAILAAASLVTAFLVTACGDDTAPAGLGDPETVAAPPASAAVPDSVRLDGALLDVTQLPAGFGELPDPGELLGAPAASSPEDASTTDPAECAAVLAPIGELSPGATGRALSRYQGLDFTSIDIDAASYAPDRVADAFAHVQEVFGKCTEYTGQDSEGIDITYQLGRYDVPSAGDASVAVRLRTESEGVTLTTDVVVMVIGTTIVQFAATGPDPIEKKVFSDLVGKQAESIRTIS